MNRRRGIERLFAACLIGALMLAGAAGLALLSGAYLLAATLASCAGAAWAGTVGACAYWRRL